MIKFQIKKCFSVFSFFLVSCLIITGCSKSDGTDNSSLSLLALLGDTWKGVPQWARSVTGGTEYSGFYSVAAGSDCIYAAGDITGTDVHHFGDQTVNGAVAFNYNVVLVKYDSDGNAQWAKSVLTGAAASSFYSVTIGSDGIYAAGSIFNTGEYDFGTATTPVKVSAAGSSRNGLLVKYDFNGNAVWARSTSLAPGFNCFESVAAGSDGIYVTGLIRNNGTYQFGDKTVIGGYASNDNALILKYDTDGNVLWAKSPSPAPNESDFLSVAVGSDGIYAAGYTYGSGEYTFGTQIVKGAYAGGNNLLLVKYDTSGNALWARSTEAAPESSIYYSVAAGSDGICTAGSIDNGSTAYNFGNDKTLTNVSSHANALIVKYDANGNTLWAVSPVTAPDVSVFYSVAIGSNGIYAAGSAYSGSTAYDFGNDATVINNTGFEGVLLVRYDKDGTAQWARSAIASSDKSYFNSVVVGDDGIYAGGCFDGSGATTTNFDFGNGAVVTGTNTDYDALLVKYR